MEKNEVIKHCGAPTVKDEGNSYWFYDRGDLNLVTRIFFVGDMVFHIFRRDDFDLFSAGSTR